MDYAYAVGELVEARDPTSNKWRRGRVTALRPYRGRPGYDVLWEKPPYSESERRASDLPLPSSVGWQYEQTMRKI